MTCVRALTRTQVARARQVSLLLGAHDLTTPAAVAAWLGAMQPQDLASGFWSLGVRLPGSRSTEIDAAVESGAVLRTWPMRGNIHIVPAEDTRWMLDLTARRSLTSTTTRRSRSLLTQASARRARRATTFGYAAHVGAICIGPNVGKQQSLVLLADWAPQQRYLERHEALTELAWR